MKPVCNIFIALSFVSILSSCGTETDGESSLAANRAGVVGQTPSDPNDGTVIYKCGYPSGQNGNSCREVYYVSDFGLNCWSGKKKLCIKDSLPVDAKWLGTARLCGGENATCPSGYREETVAKTSSECYFISGRLRSNTNQCI